MMNWTITRTGALMAGALLFLATPASAQTSSSWGSEATDSQEKAQRSDRNRVFDEKSFQGYEEYQGPYAQFGVAVGSMDYDGRVDVETGGGFSLTGGYRLLPWLAGEANVTYLGGAEAEVRNINVSDAEYFAITFGAKFFPMAAFKDQPIPEFIQPYALVAIGGGEYEVGSIRGGDNERSSFIARFMFGTDVWITDQFGAYIEGGYHAAGDDDVDGTGVFTVGGQVRF